MQDNAFKKALQVPQSLLFRLIHDIQLIFVAVAAEELIKNESFGDGQPD
ncbi:MAG TPA: hypothetical protein VEL76_41795 [Gemmataceae bacterium]|nr:hypothetical protein [Gemmataceae bacterium]